MLLAASASSPTDRADEDWEAVVPRLLLWATRLHARTLSGVRGAPTPEDLVQDAITDALTGQRVRPDGLPLLVFLYGVIRSRVSQTLSRSKTRGEATQMRYVSLEEAWNVHADSASDPAYAASLHKRVLALVAGDDLLERIVGLWFEDPDLKSRDLAVMLDVSAGEIYSATKRLRRRTEASGSLFGDPDELAYTRVSLVAWQISAGPQPMWTQASSTRSLW
jgi:DNA-directed RNA polymerase specialized sigma24 family protein